MTQMNISMKKKHTHRHRDQTFGCQGGWGKEGRGGKDWEFWINKGKLL